MKYLIFAVSFLLLTACQLTTQALQKINTFPESSQRSSTPLLANSALYSNTSKVLTLKQIMANADWVGPKAENFYWHTDSQQIYFQQKRIGSSVRDLYRQNINDKSGIKIPFEDLHNVVPENAKKSPNDEYITYIFQDNVFVKLLSTGQVTQLTYTSDIEKNAMFLLNGNVAYQVGNKFFQQSLNEPKIIELASLVFSELPDKKSQKNKTDHLNNFLTAEQHGLFTTIQQQAKQKNQQTLYNNQLKAANKTLTKTAFTFANNKKLAHAQLSPTGKHLIISITHKIKTEGNTTMPEFITESGHIKNKTVRDKVANQKKYEEQLFLLDLTTGQKLPLTYESLTGFDDDVLAEVKKENKKAVNLTYKSKKSPRLIHVINAEQPIKWHPNGKQVAIMLEAWDNKDRWLTTVDFLGNQLVEQHRLHDDAWINWAFNEFGWLEQSKQLYFLSEESGYSHLYVKPLKGKVKQLTSGNFEVSSVSTNKAHNQFYFKANKSEPGIYEVYSLATDGSNFKQLTFLNGLVDYRLSDDEEKLLLEYSSTTSPPELFVQRLTDTSIKNSEDNNKISQLTNTTSQQFKNIPWNKPEIIKIVSSKQEQPIYARVYLPANFSPENEKYKAVVFSHGAGYLQNAHHGWSAYFREFMFHTLLTEKGYVVLDMDYRASEGYGRNWRTAIYRKMGSVELEDMVDGVNWLVNNANVDRNRIGTYGGSYGGFLTLMALFKEPDLFQAGAALRLVSDWAYYNHGYTSNILNTPKDDPIAYRRSSPIYFAQGLTKPLLMNAPMVDDNVFFQDTVRLVQRLIELEKEHFETAIYPVENHGFKEPSSWLDEYRRILALFEKHL